MTNVTFIIHYKHLYQAAVNINSKTIFKLASLLHHTGKLGAIAAAYPYCCYFKANLTFAVYILIPFFIFSMCPILWRTLSKIMQSALL